MKKDRIIIKFTISPWRKRKVIDKPPKPKPRSRYAQQLWDIGAGWKDE